MTPLPRIFDSPPSSDTIVTMQTKPLYLNSFFMQDFLWKQLFTVFFEDRAFIDISRMLKNFWDFLVFCKNNIQSVFDITS